MGESEKASSRKPPRTIHMTVKVRNISYAHTSSTRATWLNLTSWKHTENETTMASRTLPLRLPVSWDINTNLQNKKSAGVTYLDVSGQQITSSGRHMGKINIFSVNSSLFESTKKNTRSFCPGRLFIYGPSSRWKVGGINGPSHAMEWNPPRWSRKVKVSEKGSTTDVNGRSDNELCPSVNNRE